jgi:hypothetical protein
MKTVRLLIRLIIAAVLLTAVSGSLHAQNNEKNRSDQTYTLIFRGDSLQQALQRLVKATGINLVYDPAIMTDHVVYGTAKKERPKPILRLILRGSHLDFVQLSTGTYVLTPAPRHPVMYGGLSGRVIDSHTGQPLAGANIMLADASGGAATDKTGHFNIPQLRNGYHKITITYMGYKSVQDTIWIPSNATASMNFSMPPQPILVEPIYIEGIQKRRPAAAALSSVLSSSQIKDLQTSATGSAVKSLNAISGINFNLPMADFTIQGGDDGSQQLRLNGVPVYNPVSMGYLLGAFSPWAIRKIIVHKAGFGASVGSQLSGVVNMIQDVGDSTENPILIEANPLNLNSRFTHQLHFKNGPSVKLMVAARANTWRWYHQPKMKQMLHNWNHLDPFLTLNLFQGDSSGTYFKAQNHSYDISYFDLHLAADIDHNKFHKTHISAYLGKNLLQTNLFSQNERIPSFNVAATTPNLFYSFDHYNWTNYLAKVEHDWLINAHLNATISGYVTHHSFNHHYVLTNDRQAHLDNNLYASPVFAQKKLKQYAVQTMNTGDKNALAQSSVGFTLKYQATNNYTLSGGLRVTGLNYRFNLSDLYYNSVQSNEDRLLIAGYLQNDFLLSRNFRFSAGSRITYVPSRDLVFAEPRLALKLDESDTPAGYFSAQLAGGIYRQFINQFDISSVGPSALVPTIKFWVPVDYTISVPKAYHISFESLLEPSNNWQIRLGSYYKWIPSRPALNYSRLSVFPLLHANSKEAGQHKFITSARGYAYGVSISAQKFIHLLNLKLQTRYQYNVSRQRIPSRFGGNYEPLHSSQPHKLRISAHWRVIPNMMLLLQWQSIWGRSWGFRKAYYDYVSIRKNYPQGNYSFKDPGYDKLPRYSQLNGGISYRVSVGQSSLQFRFDAFNLLNHKNVLNWWLMPYHNDDGSLSYRREARTAIGFRPSLGIKWSL